MDLGDFGGSGGISGAGSVAGVIFTTRGGVVGFRMRIRDTGQEFDA